MTTEERILGRYDPRGAVRELWVDKAPEQLLEGPAGTGKTYGICQLLHTLCLTFPGTRALMCRKTLTSLTSTALVTFREKVLTPEDGVTFFGGSQAEPPSFRYPNGSRIVVGGLDQESKILSSEYDIAYVNEATELSEAEWETLSTRVAAHHRSGPEQGGLSYARLIGDCNPSTDRHWLFKRCNRGQCHRYKSTHDDNPSLTAEYMATLDALTGARYSRLRLGLWVGMENAVYPQLDPSVQLQPLPVRVDWIRATSGIDFGKTQEHPSAVVTISKSSDGVVWVRECWAETGGNLQAIEDAARGQKVRYNVSSGITDPIQEVLAQRLGYEAAKSGAGTRKARISMVTKLLDAKALMFAIDGVGVRELFDEAMNYRWERRETDMAIEDQPVRKDDDRVASLEYAVQALEQAVNYSPAPAYNLTYKPREQAPKSKQSRGLAVLGGDLR